MVEGEWWMVSGKKLHIILATAFGLGYVPKGPGTAGTALGVLIAVLLSVQGTTPLFIITVLLTFFAVWNADCAEKIFGEKDSQKIVIDEVVGMMVTMIAVPLSWQSVLAGFLFFRFFDIVKVPPIYQTQKLKGGWGVVMDDVVAGVFANIVLQIFVRVAL
jgi:phosphatidylglycerophosphatase A